MCPVCVHHSRCCTNNGTDKSLWWTWPADLWLWSWKDLCHILMEVDVFPSICIVLNIHTRCMQSNMQLAYEELICQPGLIIETVKEVSKHIRPMFMLRVIFPVLTRWVVIHLIIVFSLTLKCFWIVSQWSLGIFSSQLCSKVVRFSWN